MITIIKIKRQIALFIILGSNVLMAQNNGFSGGSGHFYTGISSMNLQTVNDFMQSVQLPSFGNTCLNIGGGGFGMFNSFMIGGEGGAIVASSVSNANGEGSLGVGFGMFNIGYAIPSKSRFLMYPLIGMGWGGSLLNLRYADESKVDFTASRYFLSTEFNVELYSFGNQDGSSKAGFKAGLCVGYFFNPQTDAWKPSEAGAGEIANTFFNGPYVKIKIGGGGMNRRQTGQ